MIHTSRLAACISLTSLLIGSAVAGERPIQLISAESAGAPANGASSHGALNSDGRIVAFQSQATDLPGGVASPNSQIYVYDRDSKSLRLVSVGVAGVPGNGNSVNPVVSADGRYVAFWSLASNLVSGDSNAAEDVFVYDRRTRKVERVSLANDGSEGRDIENVGTAEGHSVAISADGRYVAFWSTASNLVAKDENQAADIFVRDRVRNTTERVSVGVRGAEANGESETVSMSADGRYVAFHSEASNLVPNDSNDKKDAFVYDRQRDKTLRISLGESGQQGNGDSLEPHLSADGRYVAFGSYADNLVPDDANKVRDVFVFDVWHGTLERVSIDSCGHEFSTPTFEVALSGNGRYAAMLTARAGAPLGAGNVLLHDRRRHTTQQIDIDLNGEETFGIYGPTDPALPSLTFDGKQIAFWSTADNLVDNDSNGEADVFLWSRSRSTQRCGMQTDPTEQGERR